MATHHTFSLPRIGNPIQRPWLRIITALILRDYDYRYRHSKIEAILIFLEPLLLISCITMIRVIGFEITPPYGPSFWTFHATGVFPFEIFVFCSQGVTRVRIRNNEFPQVRAIDVIFSRFLIEFANISVLTALFFAGMVFFDQPYAIPTNIPLLLLTIGLLGAFSFGIGLINTGLATVLPAWPALYGAFSRLLLLISGVLFVVDTLPPSVRYWVTLNPIAQGIIMFRCSFYPTYPSGSMDITYMFYCAASVLVVGAVIFGGRRRDVS